MKITGVPFVMMLMLSIDRAVAGSAREFSPQPIEFETKPCSEGWREWTGIGQIKRRLNDFGDQGRPSAWLPKKYSTGSNIVMHLVNICSNLGALFSL